MVWPSYWALVQHLLLWPGGVVVRALDLRLWRLRVWLLSLRSHVTTLGKLFTCASVTKQCNLVPVKGRWCPAVGKVTVVLAMRHRLQWFIHLQAHGLRKGDDHSAYTPHGAFIVLQAKLKIDQHHLKLQNLLYEVAHLEKEMSKCFQFKSVTATCSCF